MAGFIIQTQSDGSNTYSNITGNPVAIAAASGAWSCKRISRFSQTIWSNGGGLEVEQGRRGMV
jgi:hypothetical protein